MGEGIYFGTLHEDGTLSDERTISRKAVGACPHVILDPDHYNLDNTCKCTDPNDPLMASWGYRWDGQRWV